MVNLFSLNFCKLFVELSINGTYFDFMLVIHHFCLRGTRTQPLICVGCSVHYWVSCAINKGGFFRDCIRRRRRRHKFSALWGACVRFASLWRANSRGVSSVLGVHLSNVCWRLLFCLRKSFIFLSVLNLCKAYIFKSLLKVYYRSVFDESFKRSSFKSFGGRCATK